MSGLAHTYTTRSFVAEIVWDKDQERKRVTLVHPLYYQTEVNKFAIGERVTMKLTTQKKSRTLTQNNYYWGVYLPRISQETGNDIDDLHSLFKGKFLSKAVVEVLGEKVRRVRSTTELSVIEFGEYIERIHALTGIEPPPTEEYTNQMKPQNEE